MAQQDTCSLTESFVCGRHRDDWDIPLCEQACAERQTSSGGQTARHPASERFHALLQEMGALHDAKQADYGLDTDPFANVRASEGFGIPGWVGTMVRANDKVKRLQTLAIRGKLGNEAAVDAFMDLAVYALIARILFEEQQGQ